MVSDDLRGRGGGSVAAETRAQPRPQSRSGPALTLVSLSVSYVLSRWIWDAEFALVVCLAVLAHEFGHFLVAYVGRFESA